MAVDNYLAILQYVPGRNVIEKEKCRIQTEEEESLAKNMFVRKLLQCSPRLFVSSLLKVSSQKAKFCSNLGGTTIERPEIRPAEIMPCGNEDESKAMTYTTILNRRAQTWMDNLDDEGLKQLEELKVRIEILRAENKKVPEKISLHDYKRLLTECSTNGQIKYLRKLFLDEVKKENARKKKEMQRNTMEEKPLQFEKGYHDFSVHIPDRDIKWKQWKFLQSVQSDINIVYDLDYQMTTRESINSGKQIQHVWSANLDHLQPAHIHLTSIGQNERLKFQIEAAKRKYAVTVHEENVFDLFDRDELVYLSPDGPPLTHFDPSCTYIVGALVDLCGRPRESYGKAKANGVRTASLPLRRYLDFTYTNRAKVVLTLTAVHGILLDMYLYHSWNTALRNNLNTRWVFKDDLNQPDFVKERISMIEKSNNRKFRMANRYVTD